MAAKRVFVLCSGSVFGEGVRKLLEREEELNLVGSDTELGRALERIRDLQPDVVILDQDRWTPDVVPDLMKLREGGTQIKIIGLSLHGNSLDCYSRETRTVGRLEDLMEVIKQTGG